jgi:hypothetical protein
MHTNDIAWHIWNAPIPHARGLGLVLLIAVIALPVVAAAYGVIVLVERWKDKRRRSVRSTRGFLPDFSAIRESGLEVNGETG